MGEGGKGGRGMERSMVEEEKKEEDEGLRTKIYY